MRWRTLPGFLALVIGLALFALAMPRGAVACSCIPPGPMTDLRGDPNVAVFTATVELSEPRGIPMDVTRWFHGAVSERRVWFTASSFDGDGAACGIAPLPLGTEWVFIAYRSDGMYSTGACSPHAALATPEGQAMLAEAFETFGAPAPSSPAPTTDPPSLRPESDVGSLALALIAGVGPLLLVVTFGVGLIVGVVGVLRRTRFGRD